MNNFACWDLFEGIALSKTCIHLVRIKPKSKHNFDGLPHASRNEKACLTGKGLRGDHCNMGNVMSPTLSKLEIWGLLNRAELFPGFVDVAFQ